MKRKKGFKLLNAARMFGFSKSLPAKGARGERKRLGEGKPCGRLKKKGEESFWGLHLKKRYPREGGQIKWLEINNKVHRAKGGEGPCFFWGVAMEWKRVQKERGKRKRRVCPKRKQSPITSSGRKGKKLSKKGLSIIRGGVFHEGLIRSMGKNWVQKVSAKGAFS